MKVAIKRHLGTVTAGSILTVLALSLSPMAFADTNDAAPAIDDAPVVEIADDCEAEGNIGGAAWCLTADGDLQIGPGQMGNKELEIGTSGITKDTWNWKDYRSDVKTVTFTGPGLTKLHGGSRGAFAGMTNLTAIHGAEFLDTSLLTDGRWMFWNDSNLTDLDVSDWNTRKLEKATSMFEGCRSLTTLDVSAWETPKLTEANSMFNSVSQVTSMDLSGWDVSNVKTMAGMFKGMASVTSMDLSSWETSSLQTMSNIFASMINLTSIDLTGWDTSGTWDMKNVFYQTPKLTEIIGYQDWNTSAATDMSRMFYEAQAITDLDLSKWDVSKVKNFESMFHRTYALEEIAGLDGWDTSAATNMKTMFYYASAIKDLPVSAWDTSNVTDMTGLFGNTDSLYELDLSNWDTSNANSMDNMFTHGSDMNGLPESQLNKLWKITFGPQTCVSPSAFTYYYFPVTQPITGWDTTGKWTAVGDGSDTIPQGPFIGSSAEMADMTCNGEAGTYVWQEKLDITYHANGAPLGDTAATLSETGQQTQIAQNGFEWSSAARFMGWATEPTSELPEGSRGAQVAYSGGEKVFLPGGSMDLYATWEFVPSAPTVAEGECDEEQSVVLPEGDQGADYVIGEVEDGKVTVTATPKDGYQIADGATLEWTLDVTAPGCSIAVPGTGTGAEAGTGGLASTGASIGVAALATLGCLALGGSAFLLRRRGQNA